MKPISEGFAAAVRESHPMQTRVRVVTKWQTGTDPDGDEIDVEDGTVNYDVTADVYSTLTNFQTPGFGWDPRPGAHPIQPYGTHLFVERGIPGELIPLGYFRIASVDQTLPPDGLLRIQAQDRMAGLVEATLTTPVQFKASTTLGSVFNQLVQDVYPDAVVEFDDPAVETDSLGRHQTVDQDRYGFLRQLATSRGKLMHFDHRGILVIRSLPDLTTPLWDITSGRDGVLVQASRSLDREGVFNAVVAEAEAPDSDKPPVRVIAYDANPESPTFYGGPFGKVPTFLTSSAITRPQQAVGASRAMLERSIGLPYNATFGAVPNPALEGWDPIRVKYSDRSAREVHVVQTLSIPLPAGDDLGGAEMTGTTRERTTVRITVEGVT